MNKMISSQLLDSTSQEGFVEVTKKINDNIDTVLKAQLDSYILGKQHLRSEIAELSVQLQGIKQSGSLVDVSNSEEFYLDRICNDLLANIEEQFEINQSLKELEETLRQDYTKIYEYGQRAQTLDTLNQVKVLKQSARENEEIKTRMISALTVNQKQR